MRYYGDKNLVDTVQGVRYTSHMIKKTVYFRTQEDLDKFNAIDNKAKWLHERLNNVVFEDNEYQVTQVKIEPTITPPEATA